MEIEKMYRLKLIHNLLSATKLNINNKIETMYYI